MHRDRAPRPRPAHVTEPRAGALAAHRRWRSLFLGVFLVVPLVVVFAQALREGRGRLLRGASREPEALRRHPADAARRGHRGAAQPGLRRRRRLAHRQVRLPRQEPADHAHRPAVQRLAGDLGPDLRAALRRAGLARAVAAASTTCKIIFAVPGHRAGHHLRHLPVRGARGAARDAGAGQRRGGGGAAPWAPAAGRSSAASPCPRSSGALLYGVILCNARAMGEFGAVSVVSGHIRGETNTHAAARRDPLQRVQLRRRLRGGLAAGAARAGDAGGQEAASSAQRAERAA